MMSGSRFPASQVGNLGIFKDPASVMTIQRGQSPLQYAEVAPGDPRFEAVAMIIHVALAIVASPPGKARLTRTGHRFLEERSMRGERFVYNDRVDRLPHWVDEFLREMRSDFPNVYLTNTVRGEARMRKFDWGRDIRLYNTKTAGVLQINKMVCKT